MHREGEITKNRKKKLCLLIFSFFCSSDCALPVGKDRVINSYRKKGHKVGKVGLKIRRFENRNCSMIKPKPWTKIPALLITISLKITSSPAVYQVAHPFKDCSQFDFTFQCSCPEAKIFITVLQ